MAKDVLTEPLNDPAAQSFVKVADTTSMSTREKELMDRLAKLQDLYDKAKELNKDQQAALDEVKAQGSTLQISSVVEKPTGRLVEVTKSAGQYVDGHREDGRAIIKTKWKRVKVPTYYYKIDMPPCGGSHLMINGVPYYHGVVVELDADTLRTVKEMIYRMWDHDRQIHGSDENFYRGQNKDINPRNRMSMRG